MHPAVPSSNSEVSPVSPSSSLPVDDLARQTVAEASSAKADRSWSADDFRIELNSITQTAAFLWLVNKIKIELLLSSPESSILHTVRDHISALLSSHERADQTFLQLPATITFEIECDLISFLHKYHFEGTSSFEEIMSKLVTITSDGKDMQALTCKQYMKQTWPCGGQRVLQMLAQILESGRSTIQFEEGWINGITIGSKVCVFVSGMYEMIIETAEQLVWLGCVLRSSPLPHTIFNCTPSIKTIRYESPDETGSKDKLNTNSYCSIDYSLQSVSPAPGIASCWHKLFVFAVAAMNFPVSTRAIRLFRTSSWRLRGGCLRLGRSTRFGALLLSRIMATDI